MATLPLTNTGRKRGNARWLKSAWRWAQPAT